MKLGVVKMATKIKKCVGTVACLVCGSEIPARENEAGTLDLGCGYCDFVGYARIGTEAHQVVSASVKRSTTAPPAPVAGGATEAVSKETVSAAPSAPHPTPPAAPEKKKAGLSWMG